MLRSVLLYTALVFGANAALAAGVDWDAAKAGLPKLIVVENPIPAGSTEFTDPDGGTHRLADYQGKVVLVNFWATWCPPCRDEMPALDELQAELGGDDFAVLTIASGHNKIADIDRFFREENLTNLPVLLDPRQHLAREMGVLGLPVSVLLDREGQEIARLIGDEDWASDAAKTLIRQLTAP